MDLIFFMYTYICFTRESFFQIRFLMFVCLFYIVILEFIFHTWVYDHLE